MKAKKRSPRCPYCNGVIRGHPSDNSHVCRLTKKGAAVPASAPATVKTLEYRVVYEAEDYCGQWSEKVLRCNALKAISIAEDPRKNYPYRCRNSRIESREVSSGPWSPTMQFRGDDLPLLHASPESPLISTLRYLIALDLPKAELLDRLVKAVTDANTTVDGRPLTAAEMRHEGEL